MTRSTAALETPAAAVIRTLLLTDLVDSTKLVEKLGDARAYEVATRHDRVSRDLLPRFGGLEIDKTDGFLLLFERPIDAVGYALAYHQALAELSVELGVQLRARAGIHLGEVFLHENDPEDVARGAKPLEVEGLAKPTAARAMSLAGGKQTLLTQSAFDLARQAAAGDNARGGELCWLAHGAYRFEGVEEPVEIFEVGVEGQAPLAPPADTAKVRRAVAAGNEIILGWRPGPGLEVPRRAGWVLERRLGEGGFGEVWLARQEHTGETRVFKFCFDAERLRSLQREVTLFRLLRESLGDRREIVRILDWSFDQAPYFIEEEHVGGGDLLEWSERQGGIGEVPIAIRLEIVAQVADALAAAHSVGVLHKDVKPQNVLIARDRDGDGLLAKLGDFGISEVMDEQALLAQGITVMGLTRVATPEGGSGVTGSHLYMAPEVAEGRVASVQADVYALGVMLYQLIAGDFGRALGSGWQRDVGDELLAADIASFVDRSPERRPASAREVAERLRTLEERRREIEEERRAKAEAEAARVALERAQRRRKVLTVIAAAAVVVLAVVSVLAIQAVLARREADRSRIVAEQRRGQAEDLIGFMLGDLRAKLDGVGRLEILDDVGAKAMDYFAAVPMTELSDAELAHRSQALYQIGSVRLRQGKLAEAVQPFEDSLALARELTKRHPGGNEHLFGLGQSHFWVGNAHWEQGNLEEALEQFQPYLEISQRLAAGEPENLDYQLELCYAHSNIGSILEAQGELEEALERFLSALAINKKLHSAAPDNPTWRSELAASHNAVGVVQLRLGDVSGARRHFQQDLDLREILVRSDPTNTTWLEFLGTSHVYIGRILGMQGEWETALDHFRESRRTFNELATHDPSNMAWRYKLALGHLWTGSAFDELDDGVARRSAWQTSHRILVQLVAGDPLNHEWQRELGVTHYLLALDAFDQGDLKTARVQVRNAVNLLQVISEDNPKDNRTLAFFCESLILSGRIDEALEEPDGFPDAWLQATELIQSVAQDSGDPLIRMPWARLLLHLERLEDARKTMAAIRKSSRPDRRLLALCLSKGAC